MSRKNTRLLASLAIAAVALAVAFFRGELPTSPPRDGEVVRVVDGDTFVAMVDGKEEKIRIIGIDAPESVDPRQPVDCFGKASAYYLEDLLENESVTLTADPTQNDRDMYGRLLRYATLDDGEDLGAKLIASGYAQEYTFRTAYQRQGDYLQLEESARAGKRGLWATNACETTKNE